jgi:hypothetical protein
MVDRIGRFVRRYARFGLALALIALAIIAGASHSGSVVLAADQAGTAVRLPGHVLPALAQASRVAATSRAANAESQPLTLTVVLNRRDEQGFQRYLADVENPSSPNHLKFLSQAELTRRFGPSQQSYDAVLAWLKSQGFSLSQGSANRLTLTVKGTRAQAEQSFQVNIGDYSLKDRSFYATDQDPAVPANLAPAIQDITGLNDLAQPQPPNPGTEYVYTTPEEKCLNELLPGGKAETASIVLEQFELPSQPPAILAATDGFGPCIAAVELNRLVCLSVTYDNPAARCEPGAEGGGAGTASRTQGGAARTPGAGQKVGLVEFDTFQPSDVSNWLQLVSSNLGFGVSPVEASQVSEVNVNGGVATPGSGESEVLLDIDAILALAPGAQVTVYDAPQSTSDQAVFNAMLTDPAGPPSVISNSWAYCENETSQADVQSIDAIFQQAAGLGIGVFNGAGDTGSTCLDGSPNTVAVPADSPNATAVGGTSVVPDTGLTYGSETWWDGSQSTPQTGQGGFGQSRFFSRPSYQAGLTTASQRSVPDVAANADPVDGFQICEADTGGCPDGLFHGGTSLAAPEWAATEALLNQAQGHNLGPLNPLLYPLAQSAGFHSAQSMGSDFAHVGLGSPNVANLLLALQGRSPGPVSGTSSTVTALPAGAPADGTSPAAVLVQLRDAGGNPVSGVSVSLTPNTGSQAVVSPTSGVSSTGNGTVSFNVTDSTVETVTFSATDTTDSLPLKQVTVAFVSPPATSGNILPVSQSVAADGSSPATITVTLQNAQKQGASGKTVTISQGGGHSRVTATGTTPGVTDNSGKATFTATDGTAETVTYTATDVTDGNLPVPGSARVTFGSGQGNVPCGGAPATASGYAFTEFASGFPFGFPSNFCEGPTGVALDSSGDLYVLSTQDANLYRFGPQGGVANASTLVAFEGANYSGPGALAFSKDGMHLYLGLGSGSVVEIDPNTGATLRTLGSLSCPTALATDPISGDLFASQDCTNTITRISQPESGNPTLSIYSTPGNIDGIAFGPDGTLYAAGVCFNCQNDNQLIKIDGTNSATPGQATDVVTINGADGIAVGLDPSNPSQTPYVFVNGNFGNIAKVDLTTATPTLSNVFTGGSRGDFVAVGPDGCLYATQSDSVIKVTKSDGTCSLLPTNPAPQISVSPSTINPNPATGTPETFTATLHNFSNPQGTNITFTVSGANPQSKLVQADANGQASFTYTGAVQGLDTIAASASTGTSLVTSPPASVTWAAGRHVTFTDLNASQTSGAAGVPATLTAHLTDVSQSPPLPISDQPITISIAAQSCPATTDATGTASCSITPTETAGSYPLVASYAGNSQYTGSSATDAFQINPCAQRGDVNCDTRVDSVDALCVLRLVAALPGTSACPSPMPGNPDVNNDPSDDGSTGADSTDALCILRHIANLPATGACPAWGSQPAGASRGSGVGGRALVVPTQSAVRGPQSSISLLPSEVTGRAGTQTAVSVTFDASRFSPEASLSGTAASSRPLGAWTADIAYDPAAVSVVSCTPAAGSLCNTSFAPGVVRIVGASASGLSGNQNLATITFERKGGGPPSALRVATVELADSTGAPLPPSGNAPQAGRTE